MDQILLNYFHENPVDLDEYVWPRGNPVCAEETIRQRFELAEAFKQGCPKEKFRVAEEFVRVWGGVTRNKPERILEYVSEEPDDTRIRPVKGIATWSKILSIRDPEQFLIFDARVSFSLNAVFEHAGHGSDVVFFPKLPGRNTVLRNALLRQQALGRAWNIDLTLQGGLLYPAYLALLHSISKQLDVPSIHLEMMLFARAPAFAQALWPQPTTESDVSA